MEPFATSDAVQNRLDFTLDDDELRAVDAYLEDMSDEARLIGGRTWTDPTTVPAIVRNTVVKSVTRWARNMNSFIQSRAGDETLIFTDLRENAGAPYFTDREEKLIKSIADGRVGGTFNGTVELTAWGPSRYRYDDIYVPVDYGGKPFPFNTPWPPLA